MKANLNKCHLLLSTTDAFNFEISPPPPPLLKTIP